MATLLELLTCRGDLGLQQRVLAASIVVAEAVRSEDSGTPNHGARLTWARRVFENPQSAAESMLWAVLAQNHEATTAQIINATDEQVLAAVANAVNVFTV